MASSLINLLKQSGIVAPLSKKGLRKELKAAGQLKYGQELRDLKKERRITRATQKRNQGWFDDYQNKIQAAQSDSAANYAATGTQLANQSNQGYVQDAAQSATINAQRGADAQLYGAKSAPTGADTLAQASSFRSSQGAAQRASLASQGAANYDYLGGRRATAAGSALASRLATQKRQQVLREETRDVKKERQDFKVDLRRELRGAERQFLSDLLANKLGKKGHALDALTQSQLNDQFYAQLAQDAEQHAAELAAEAEKPDPDDPTKRDRIVAQQNAYERLNEAFQSMKHIGGTVGPKNQSPFYNSEAKNRTQFAKEFRQELLAEIRRATKIGKHQLTPKQAKAYLRRWIAKKPGAGSGDESLGDALGPPHTPDEEE